MDLIPYNLPTIEEDEINEVVATLRSGWLTTGRRTAQFEAEFKAYVQAPCALAVNSATAGLHLALAALQIGPGDEVITTPLTFCSTVNTIIHVGATPVLADIGPDGNIDPQSIADRITPRTRAIVPVHLGGLPCDMDSDLGAGASSRIVRDRGRRPRRRISLPGCSRSEPLHPVHGRAERRRGVQLLRHEEPDDGRGRNGDDARSRASTNK